MSTVANEEHIDHPSLHKANLKLHEYVDHFFKEIKSPESDQINRSLNKSAPRESFHDAEDH